MQKLLLILIVTGFSLQAWAEPSEPNPVVKLITHYPNGNGERGTGWFINDHAFVTDYHVVSGGASFEIVYPDRAIRTAHLVKWNTPCDLALLTVDNPRPNQQWINLVEDSQSINGPIALTAIGYPHGERKISSGTALNGLYADPTRQDYVVLIKSDLETGPGGSGSPVLNADGKVVGMVEAVSVKGQPYACYIISADVIWEALGITNPTIHPNGFNTGITADLDLNKSFLPPGAGE